jgi:hypothetical protein
MNFREEMRVNVNCLSTIALTKWTMAPHLS